MALRWITIAGIALLGTATPGVARNTPPNIPVITEPPFDGCIVSAADLHMATAPFSDPDDGDRHDCTDWEIATNHDDERAWTSRCATGFRRTHTHFGDGSFVNSHADRTELFTDTDYILRARHRDNSGDRATEWSDWSERRFTTGPGSVVLPMLLEDVSATPRPEWRTDEGNDIILGAGAVSAEVHLQTASGDTLLLIRALNGLSNDILNPGPLFAHHPVRILVRGGGSGANFPASQLTLTDQGDTERKVFLPEIVVGADQSVHYWLSANGSSYLGMESQTEPDFTVLCRGPVVPWTVFEEGYKVEVAATGFQLPVNIAFTPIVSADPGSPFYYVAELYGTVKVVKRDGSIGVYADSLLNFNPTGDFPGSGEQGISGIAVDGATGDLFLALLYDAEPPNGPHYPKVVRLHSTDGGLSASSQSTVLDMPGETQFESHFVSNLTIGPDGKLYVHLGDGFAAEAALDLESFRGKIIRVNPDGTAPSDNPFFDGADGLSARDYVYAYGFRNPFGGAWRSADGQHYEVENGPRTDRFARVVAGKSYGWNGVDDSMFVNATYNWLEPHAPVNLAFIQRSTFDGSGFPPEAQDHAFVTEAGPTWLSGPTDRGKQIVKFRMDKAGQLLSGPIRVTSYNGSGKASAVGLASGPDGLYFSDFYKDLNYVSPIDTGSNILRIRYVGHADFAADFTNGYRPLSVQFTDLSAVTAPGSWLWNFGDGSASTVQSPIHTFTEDGVYTIRLSVTSGSDVISRQKNAYVIVGDPAIGLSAEYFPTADLTGRPLRRIDGTVDFDWAEDAPFFPLPADSFSVRWSGRVKARFGESYTFWTLSEGGVRLWVDEQVIIDDWIEQGPTESDASVALESERSYAIRLEFYDGAGDARVHLSWSSPSQPKEIIPQASLYGSAPFPPAQVRLVGPPANAEIADESVRLVWNGNTPVPDRYWLEVSVDSSFSCGLSESTVVDTARVVAPLRPELRYYWRVRARNGAGWGPFSETWTFDTRWSGGTTGLEFSVAQNYPNPFGPATQIEYAVPEASGVSLTVFDVLGRRVKALVHEFHEPGLYRRKWDGEDEEGSTVGNGVYFYRMEAVAERDGRRFTTVRKMIRVR